MKQLKSNHRTKSGAVQLEHFYFWCIPSGENLNGSGAARAARQLLLNAGGLAPVPLPKATPFVKML